MTLIDRIRNDKYALLSAIVCGLLVILILYSFYVRIRMNMLGISLWNDEAKLAENIVNRTMGEMLTPPLANRQTAPVLYLVVVKALTSLFGASETVLRLFSFISFAGMLAAQGVLLRKVFKVRMVFTLFSVAVSSTFLYYMQYSHEFKPYMGDATFVLLILVGYYAYREGFLGSGVKSAILLGLICAACMLFSSPAAFAAGAVFVVEFLAKCIRKDRDGILLIVMGGAVFLIIFILNYFLWLRPIATDGGMLWYWLDYRFDFNIFSREALLHNFHTLWNLMDPIRHAVVLTLPLAVSGFVISLSKRNIYTAAVGVFFFLLLVASALDKYPILSRLWMFLFVIIFIYAFIAINAIRISINEGKAAKALKTLIPLALSCILLIPNMPFPAFGRGEEWTLMPGNQATPLINYVRENIRDGEMLYSYLTASFVLKFKNGYDSRRIGSVSDDNIIFGTEDYRADVDLIADTDGAYVLFFHSYYPLSQDTYVRKMTGRLQDRGFMEQILNIQHTYLYWFTDDLVRIRASASLDVFDLKTYGGGLTAVVRVENTGEAILAPQMPGGHPDPDDGPGWDDYGRLFVVLFEADCGTPSADLTDGIMLGEFTSPVAPGEAAELLIGREGLAPGEYRIELVSYGAYSFSELGLEPVFVTVPK